MELIRQYLKLMEQALGMDVVIYDECRLLSHTQLAQLAQTGKWHTNPYCLKIKECQSLQNRCVRLKKGFVSQVTGGEGVVKTTCYCGVTEYAAPVYCQAHLVCIVSAVGFKGDLRCGIERNLCKRIGVTRHALQALREQSLRAVQDEEKVKDAVSILAQLLQRYVEEQTPLPQWLGSKQTGCSEHVLRALDYIGENFTKPVDAQMVASYCHINKSHLQHLFSRILGHGVAEEIRRCRIEYAKELLCTTGYSVEYISYLCGFSSADYFSTAFKKQAGMPPLQYRKKCVF